MLTVALQSSIAGVGGWRATVAAAAWVLTNEVLTNEVHPKTAGDIPSQEAALPVGAEVSQGLPGLKVYDSSHRHLDQAVYTHSTWAWQGGKVARRSTRAVGGP